MGNSQSQQTPPNLNASSSQSTQRDAARTARRTIPNGELRIIEAGESMRIEVEQNGEVSTIVSRNGSMVHLTSDTFGIDAIKWDDDTQMVDISRAGGVHVYQQEDDGYARSIVRIGEFTGSDSDINRIDIFELSDGDRLIEYGDEEFWRIPQNVEDERSRTRERGRLSSQSRQERSQSRRRSRTRSGCRRD